MKILALVMFMGVCGSLYADWDNNGGADGKSWMVTVERKGIKYTGTGKTKEKAEKEAKKSADKSQGTTSSDDSKKKDDDKKK